MEVARPSKTRPIQVRCPCGPALLSPGPDFVPQGAGGAPVLTGAPALPQRARGPLSIFLLRSCVFASLSV